MSRITTHEKGSTAQIDTTTTATNTPLYLDEDITPNVSSSWRTASWASEDTLGRGEDGALLSGRSEDRSTVDFDLNDDESSYTSRRRRRPWLIFFAISGIALLICLLALDILLRVSMSVWVEEPDDPVDTTFSRWGQPGSGTEDLAWYPTNFLQDVHPKPIHSHNDYWRRVPLFTALRQGCTGVEADVWLFDNKPDKLYVGHARAALQPNRTFQSLYIDPLVEILTHQNPVSPSIDGGLGALPEDENENGTSSRGVFDTDPTQTLTLLVDVKTAGPATWAAVVAQLAPLRERGWLSFYADGVVHTRAVTVVGTGNTAFADVVANETYRDYFFDAPLHKLADVGVEETYDPTNSYYASVSFGATIGAPWMGRLGAEQVERIRRQVRAAHARGLKARYWDLPSWPVSTRNRIWDLLVQEGVDMLNVDDVKGAARRRWKY